MFVLVVIILPLLNLNNEVTLIGVLKVRSLDALAKYPSFMVIVPVPVLLMAWALVPVNVAEPPVPLPKTVFVV